MASPYKGKRVALGNILYPRYDNVEDLLGVPAVASQKAAVATKRPHPEPAVAAPNGTPAPTQPALQEHKSSSSLMAAAEAAAAAGMDPEAVAILQRKAAKRAKREERRKPGSEAPQVVQDVVMQPVAEAPAQLHNSGFQAVNQAQATKQPAASGNAEEAAKIRAALGYTAAAPQAPAPVPDTNKQGSFGFGFSVEQRVEAETEAKIARIMAIDSTKDGFVPRRVWACGLPHEYSEDQVREYWEYCGQVESLDLLTFKDSNRFNGAAFVTFRTQEGYEAALAADGEELEGRKLRVEKCKVPVPKKGALRPTPQQPAVVASGAPPALSARQAPAPAPAAAPAAAQPAEANAEYNVAYVGNISFETTEQELTDLFKPYNVAQVRLHLDQKTGRPKGFAHIHFNDAGSLTKSLAVDGAELHGRNLKVLPAQPPKKK